MRLFALIVAALVATGCTLRDSDEEPERPAADRPAPEWLDATYTDGTVRFDYPGRWKVSSSATFGGLVLDNVSQHPAFISVRYLPRGEATGDPADLVARTIRPPEGQGLTLLYSQTAYVGGTRSREVGFMWSTRSETPVGPTLRTFVTPLADGRTALLVFATERPRQHGGVFRWVRETLRWDAPVRSSARPPGGRIPAHA
jgi:hypothetical protein